MSFSKPDYDNGPSLRTIAMPADTNANGDMFGGWMLSQMDLAGSILAIQKARTRVATVGIEAMSFEKPVFVGDEVSCYCRIHKIGNTSITIHVESWARGRLDETARKVTAGKFSYVAIDAHGNPVAVIRDNGKEHGA